MAVYSILPTRLIHVLYTKP